MGLGQWLRRVLGHRPPAHAVRGDPPSSAPAQASPSTARWLGPDDDGNPFGVRLLSLMGNLSMISTTRDPAIAARAVGWRAGGHREVDLHVEGWTSPCDLRYPAPAELCEGLLYRPQEMEDKWVIAYRDGRVAAARSWTGDTKAVARARHVDGELILSELTFAQDSGFASFGDPIAAFDWLMRAHALGARIPFPADKDGIERLAAAPLSGFSLYGRQMFCAAQDYDMGAPSGRVHSDGDLVAAVLAGDVEQVVGALAAGAPVDAPCSFDEGATALRLAIYLHPGLVEPLLRAGADVNIGTRRGSTPLMAVVAADRPQLLGLILDAGAELHAADESGFTAAHVAAQFGNTKILAALVERGASLSAQNKAGLTPLHVAAGTGERAAVEWLIGHGVDPLSPSPLGSALEIAEREGHEEVARLLRASATPGSP